LDPDKLALEDFLFVFDGIHPFLESSHILSYAESQLGRLEGLVIQVQFDLRVAEVFFGFVQIALESGDLRLELAGLRNGGAEILLGGVEILPGLIQCRGGFN